jgi:hypothetical protein
MPKLALATCLSIAALAAVPAANAAVLPGQTLDGPSADIVAFGDVDLAPDGSGALAYLKVGTGTQDQVFVARRVGGVWQPPQEVSNGGNDAVQPQVAAANGGRVVVAWRTATNNILAKVAPGGGQPFGSEITVHGDTNANNFDLDGNDTGIAYVAYHSQTGDDIYASRIAGSSATHVGGAYPAGKLQKDDGETAGGSDRQGGPQVAVDSTGNAVAVWAETRTGDDQAIFARRIAGTTPAAAAVQASVDTPLDGHDAKGSDNAAVDTDGAGNAWVVFRENFTYAADKGRAIARRLVGGTFEGPLVADNGGADPGDCGTEFSGVAIDPSSQGYSAGFFQCVGANNWKIFGAVLKPGAATPFALQSAPSNGVPPDSVAVAPVAGGAGLFAITNRAGTNPTDPFDLHARVATAGALAPPLTASNPAFGTVDTSARPAASADANGSGVIGYGQGAAAQKRILVATLDLPKSGGGGGVNARPVISRLKLSRTTFRKGSKLPKASAKKYKTGTTIGFRLSETAKVRLSFEAIKKGRRVGKKCKAPTRRNRKRKSCRRYVKVKTAITVNGKAGANKVSFQGRLNRRKSLRPGRYRLTLVATDGAGLKSKAVRKNFRLLAAAKKKRR